jgi:hypothetical protein
VRTCPTCHGEVLIDGKAPTRITEEAASRGKEYACLMTGHVATEAKHKIEELKVTCRLALLHLMVRPESRLVESEEHLKDILRKVLT